MKNTEEYLKYLNLEFDYEGNRTYYESRIIEMVNEVKNDLINEILNMYVPDGNPEIWKEKIEKLKNKT